MTRREATIILQGPHSRRPATDLTDARGLSPALIPTTTHPN